MKANESNSIRNDFKNAYWEGIFGSPIATISSGVLLTGYALYLGSNSLEISIIIALPFLTQIVQLFGPNIIQAFGSRRQITAYSTLSARVMWIPIAVLPLLKLSRDNLILAFILLNLVSLIFFNISQNSWLLWMSDLVPRKLRGRFFGRRNMYIGVVSMSYLLAAGYFLDAFTAADQEGWGYSILIFVGVTLAIVAFRYLQKIDERPVSPETKMTLVQLINEIKNNSKIRSILKFVSVWTVVTGIAAPFYFVHIYQNLKWSYNEATIYAAIVTGLPFILQPFWGSILDRVGHKPLLHLAISSSSVIPIIWFSLAPSWSHLLWGEAVLSGVIWAGINITMFSLVIYALPGERKSPVIAIFASITGLLNAFAMLIGGIIATLTAGMYYQIGEWSFTPYHLLFLLTFVGRLVAVKFVNRIEEPEAHKLAVISTIMVSGITKRVNLGRQFWFFINGRNNRKSKK